MQTTNFNIKIIIAVSFFYFLSGFLFAQKVLDHELFLEKIKHSSDTIYKDCINEYDAYIEKFPNDVSVLIEKCKFIQYAQYDDYYNPNQSAFDSCSADIISRFSTHPEVLLFQTTYLWGEELEEVFNNAEKSVTENPQQWKNTDLAALYKAIANYYYYESDYKQSLIYAEKAISNDSQSLLSGKVVKISFSIYNKLNINVYLFGYQK